MQVRHGLSSPFFAIKDQAVAIADAQLLGQPRGNQVQMTEHAPVFLGDIGMSPDGFAGDHQDVNRRLRVNIAKGQALLVFVNDVGRDFPVDDFLKEVVRHHDIHP